MSTEKRIYKAEASTTIACINALENYLIQDNFKCQQMPTEDGGILLQIEKKGGWRKLTGNSTALNITFHQENEHQMTVEIGAGRWVDKAGAGAVGMLIFAPLAVTAVIGAVKQSKMSGKIFEYIENYLGAVSKGSPLINNAPTFSSAPSTNEATNQGVSDKMKVKSEINALDDIINADTTDAKK
jgi:hypothetical protein